MVPIKTSLANKENYGGARSTSAIKYIVIHFTANDGDSDESNAKYFQNKVTKTSAHYFVDDDSITRTVPDNSIAYHCGASTYKHSTCRNANSIGIELCDALRNGTVYPTEKTIRNALELTKSLMQQYGIPAANVIRHYDVTGKACPAYWCCSPEKDAKWKSEFWGKLLVQDAAAAEKNSEIIIDGKTYPIDRILVGGANYFAVRELIGVLNQAGVCRLDIGNKGSIAVLTSK